MTTPTHTPEPWEASGFCLYHKGNKPLALMDTYYLSDVAHLDGDENRSERSEIGEQEAFANAKRIVACVNGCAGLNPAAYRRVVGELEEMVHRFDHLGEDSPEDESTLAAARDALAEARRAEE